MLGFGGLGGLVAVALACGHKGSSSEAGTDGTETGSATEASGTEAVDDSGGPVSDCAGQPDLTPCEGQGVCLADACVPLPACSGTACSVGPASALPDTNLRVCYGASPDGTDGTIACPGSPGGADCASTDYCGGDAQYGWDVAHPASARFVVGPGDEPVVTDAVTGLQWQRCVLGQSGATCTGDAQRVDWFTAESTCADSTWGGFDDWVLPSSHVAQSIYDYGTTSPAIDTSVFVNAPSGFDEDPDQWWIECQWSSTDYAQDANVAWAMMVNNGDVSSGSGIEYHSHDKGAEGWEGCYVRCVRAHDAPTTQRLLRFEPVPGEPMVADTVTSLVWQGCSAGQSGSTCGTEADAAMLDWRTALATCEGLSWGGHDDWRLPDIKELRSIVDERVTFPALDAAMFPATPYYGPDMTTDNIGQYWSSTARSYNSFALYVDFGFGFSHFYVQDEGRHVRCVRGG